MDVLFCSFLFVHFSSPSTGWISDCSYLWAIFHPIQRCLILIFIRTLSFVVYRRSPLFSFLCYPYLGTVRMHCVQLAMSANPTRLWARKQNGTRSRDRDQCRGIVLRMQDDYGEQPCTAPELGCERGRIAQTGIKSKIGLLLHSRIPGEMHLKSFVLTLTLSPTTVADSLT